MKKLLIGGVAAAIMYASMVVPVFADGPTSPNVSPVVVPLAQTGTFGQTVCSVLGQANLENNVVLTVQGHDPSHIN
ncbi:hypothetical protein HYS91_04640 [Candidatus Daviesbacteria bacterium]|nr:hypothetical protein [Candidatus Daviesbacteria bacterium]